MMPNGYRYNPADYRKDFSWVGDIGKTLAQVAYKMPELVRYNQQIKENRGLNKQTYESMREWVGSMRDTDPEVWNALAAGYNVAPDKLGPTLLSRLRGPKKNESNEAYAKSVLDDFAAPIVRTGMSTGLQSGAFMRSVSNMPGVAGAGTAQGQLMQDFQKRSKVRKKEERVAATEAGITEALGAAGEAPTKESFAAALAGGEAPGIISRPEAGRAAAVLPSGLAQERERRLRTQADKPPRAPAGTVRSRMENEVDQSNRELRGVDADMRANEREVRALEAEVQKSDEEIIEAKKLPPDKLAAKQLRIERLKAANVKLEGKAAKQKQKLADNELAVQLYDQYGGDMSPEEIWKAIRSGQNIEAPQAGAGVVPPGGSVAPPPTTGGQRSGRFVVTPVQ